MPRVPRAVRERAGARPPERAPAARDVPPSSSRAAGARAQPSLPGEPLRDNPVRPARRHLLGSAVNTSTVRDRIALGLAASRSSRASAPRPSGRTTPASAGASMAAGLVVAGSSRTARPSATASGRGSIAVDVNGDPGRSSCPQYQYGDPTARPARPAAADPRHRARDADGTLRAPGDLDDHRRQPDRVVTFLIRRGARARGRPTNWPSNAYYYPGADALPPMPARRSCRACSSCSAACGGCDRPGSASRCGRSRSRWRSRSRLRSWSSPRSGLGSVGRCWWPSQALVDRGDAAARARPRRRVDRRRRSTGSCRS